MNTPSISGHCRNCDAPLGNPPGNYCPNCGQDTHNHPPTFLEFAHEFVTHYVAAEGKLWKTLRTLFFKPGELTREYRNGRKQGYIGPLRLYVTASFIFFLMVQFTGWGNLVQTNITTSTEVTQNKGNTPDDGKPAKSNEATPKVKVDFGGLHIKSNDAKPAAIPANELVKTDLECALDGEWCQKLQAHLNDKWKGKNGDDVINTLKKGVLANFPYAMFFMMPIFALITQFLYYRRKQYFGEHLVYALHVHAFAFFTLLAKVLLPRVVGDIVFLLSIFYYFVALQRNFGGRWWLTTLRFGFIGIVYPLLLAFMTMLVIFISVVI